MKSTYVFIAAVIILVQGCATPYSQFYFSRTGGMDITKDPTVIVTNEEPKLFRGSDKKKDVLAMRENGYKMVGYSSFNASNVDQNGAIAQAKKVHASVVLIYSQYRNTVSGVMPLTLPDIQTSTTSLYGNAYHSGGGSANYSGSATTTTYGSKTTYIPYSVNRYNYLATYWVKRKFRLGVFVIDLTPEIKKEVQSNKGALVIAVVKGSPAFQSDILEGDVLKSIDHTEIYDARGLSNIVAKYEGQNVVITIYRSGKLLRKEVQLKKCQWEREKRGGKRLN